ncbi:hypothetical protein ACFLR9_08465 [Bacteroidota bacterium]
MFFLVEIINLDLEVFILNMTLYEYKMLSEDEQYDTVFRKGKSFFCP